MACSGQTERVAPYVTSRAALVPAIPLGLFVLASLPLVIVLGESREHPKSKRFFVQQQYRAALL